MRIVCVGVVSLVMATALRTCSSCDRGTRDIANAVISSKVKDGSLSLISPVLEEIPSCWANTRQIEDVGMSNMWILAVMDDKIAQWKIRTAATKFYFFAGGSKCNTCVYDARSDKIMFADEAEPTTKRFRGAMNIPEIISANEVFDKFPDCAGMFLGNGETGIMCWRGNLTSRQAYNFLGYISRRSKILVTYVNWQELMASSSARTGTR